MIDNSMPLDILCLVRAVQNSSSGFLVLDKDLRIVFANNVASELSSQRTADLFGVNVHAAFPDLQSFQKKKMGGISWHKAGTGWLVLLGEPEASLASSNKSSDYLTKLPDRAQMMRDFRTFEKLSGVIICLDLDDFKRANDTLGHEVGDNILRVVARRLASTIRQEDKAYRIGGDEFVVVLSSDDAKFVASNIATRILDMINRPFVISGNQVAIGASAGLSVFGGLKIPVERALHQADIALYRSKKQGRHRSTWFAPGMEDELRERRNLEVDMRKALLLDQFELEFQPQLDLRTKKITGFEALLRWNHPTRGRVDPTEFIPVAEENGMILEIGEWILNAACQEAAKWPDQLKVSVNVSAIQFIKEGFEELVYQALNMANLNPERLELELTESILFQGIEKVAIVVRRLRSANILVSLGDFGTGFSSLSHLESLAFSKVKIDHSFIQGDDQRLNIVESITNIAGKLGVEVLAEGVETIEQLREIGIRGVGSAQGYLIGKPLSSNDLENFLRDFRANFVVRKEEQKVKE